MPANCIMLIPYTSASPTLQSCYRRRIDLLKKSNSRRQNLDVPSCSMTSFTKLTKVVAQRKYYRWSIFPPPHSLPSPKPSSVQKMLEFFIRLRTVALNAFDAYFPSLDNPTSTLVPNISWNEVTFKDVRNQFELSFQLIMHAFQLLREYLANIVDAFPLGFKIGILGMLLFVFMYRKHG